MIIEYIRDFTCIYSFFYAIMKRLIIKKEAGRIMNITFGKLLKADLKKRLWLIILIFAVSLIAYPFFYQVFISSIADGDTTFTGNVTSLVLDWRNRSIYYIITFAAVLSAVTGFAYLYSEKYELKYQGRRIDSATWFKKRWLGGFLEGIIPVIIGAMIALFAVAPINVAFSPEAVGIIFSTLGIITLGYSAIYASCVLAMVIAGNVISGLLMCAFFLGYAPMCSAIIQSLKDNFFASIYYPDKIFTESPFMYFSPVTALRILTENPADIWGWVSIFAFLVGGIIIGFFLNRYRTGENPGYAMLNDVMRGTIKAAWGIAVAMVSGGIFTIFSEDKATWLFIVGAFIGAFVVYVIIHYIINYDFQSSRRPIISGCVTFGGVLLAVILLFLDPIGINRTIPKIESISKMSVASSDTSGQLRLLGSFLENENSVNARDTDWLLTNTFIDKFEYIYAVAEEGIKYDNPKGRSYTEIYVGFELKDGKRLYRRYNIDLDTSRDAVDRLFGLKVNRERFYPTAHLFKNIYKSAQLSGWDFASLLDEKNNLTVNLSEEQCKKLTYAIRKDSLARSSTKLRNSIPAGKLVLKYEGGGYDEVYIYPEYIETIKVFRELKIKRAINDGFFKLPNDIKSAVLRVSETSNALRTSGDSDDESKVDFENINDIDGNLYGTYRTESREYEFKKKEIDALLKCMAPARSGVQESKDKTYTLTLKRGDKEQDFYEAVVTDEEALGRLLEGK